MNRYFQILLVLLIVTLGVLFFFLNPAEHPIFPECIFHSTTGYYCPGCGSQRAVHNLLHLNFAGVVKSNFLFLPAGLLIVYHYTYSFLNEKLKWKLPNIFYFKATPCIIFAVVVLFWILRNLPVYPFSSLAPG